MDTPTLIPVDPFTPSEDVKNLNQALAGVTTNEAAVIDIMCYRSTNQRTVIASTYNSTYGKVRKVLKDFKRIVALECCPFMQTLASVFKDKLLGAFQDMMVLMTYPTPDYLALELHRCFTSGLGSDNDCVTEMLISRTNLEINQTNVAYERSMSLSSLIATPFDQTCSH